MLPASTHVCFLFEWEGEGLNWCVAGLIFFFCHHLCDYQAITVAAPTSSSYAAVDQDGGGFTSSSFGADNVTSAAPAATISAATATATGSSSPGGGDVQDTTAAAEPTVMTKVRKVARRAPSAFMIFSTAKRAEVKNANPTATFGEIGTILSAQWAALTEAEKQVKISLSIIET
jgi:HMG (high mobility group) box